MGLKGDLVSLPMEARFTYDAHRELCFINLEWYVVRTPADIEAIAKAVKTLLAPLHKKVSAIVNYDNFILFPERKEAYIDMVKNLADKYFSRLTRYTTSTFLRMKG
jgi:propionate CoA-transferase